MKIITMYLPQFHRVKENDEWWGTGFTEWTAVKAAEPIFEGHCQPRIPLNDNYYDLMDKRTMQWQAQLMHQFHVYGQAFYHYWFKDGRQILEKPAENLLKWVDIDMPFCFSWANESWTRTWSNLREKNAWSDKFEPQEERNSHSGILLEQKYGDESDWEKHFDYLLPFFRDERYIKVDGKPAFIFYKPESIPCLAEMTDLWRKIAAEEGFPGLYLIGNRTTKNGILDAALLQEPQFTLSNYSGKKIVDGNEFWKESLKADFWEKCYYCGFLRYDDTPRRGKAGTIVQAVKPDEFEFYMKQLLAKSEQAGNEYVFFNAWNEWGEGMYLEPDTENEYAMLEAVASAVCNYKISDYCVAENSKMNDTSNQIKLERYRGYWILFDRWMAFMEEGRSLEQVLLSKGYTNIAVYGMGMFGLHVVRQLANSQVKICYGIDQREDISQPFPVFLPDAVLPEVDAIIVSTTYDLEAIVKRLRKQVNCKIISLETLIG